MTDGDWSVPETEVLATVRDLLESGEPAVIATVVDVEGSAYRRPGAKMVVVEDGEGFGHITAGCLEDEVFDLTAEVLAAGEPRVETYDLMNDDDDIWGLGVGCNGIIDILLEPLDDSYRPVVEAFESDEPLGLVTVVSGDAPRGAKAYYRPGSGLDPVEGFPGWLADAVENVAADLTDRGGADSLTIETDEGTAEVFVDGIKPTPKLVVVGSGNDVGPVVELGKLADFRVSVVGFRGGIDLEGRFPDADDHYATSPGEVTEAVAFDANTYVVVMTHNFIDDRLALDAIVGTSVEYIGLLGPRERFEEMLEEFEAEGRTFSEEELAKVYTPIGLDLGGGSPYQIATSVVAEVLAVHNGRAPRHLREREGHIHDRIEVDSAASD